MMSDAIPSGKASYPALRWCSIRNRSKKGNAGLKSCRQRKNRNGMAGNFLGAWFGKVTDKFGVPWMINVVKQHQRNNPPGGPPSRTVIEFPLIFIC